MGQVVDVLGQRGRPRPAGDCAPQPAEAVDRFFAQAHARELRRWAGCIGEATAENIRLILRPAEARLELPSLPRQHDDLDHGRG